MASPLYLTMLAGPVEAVPVPKPFVDALVSAQVTESATGRSGFQLTFTLSTIQFCKRCFFWLRGLPSRSFA